MQAYTSSLNFEIISPRVPPVPHKGWRMYSSAAEATGGAVAITRAVVVQDTPWSSVLGPAIICSRATHVPPVLPLLFPFPPGFAVAPAAFYSRAKLDGYAAQIQVQPGTSKRVKRASHFPFGAHIVVPALSVRLGMDNVSKMVNLATTRS